MRVIPRGLAKLLAAMIAAFAITLTMSSNAIAGSNGPTLYDSSNYKASGVFLSYGDLIRVEDHYADGRSAVVVWNDPHLDERRCWDSNGANNGYSQCNYNLTEGAYVDYEVCLGEYGARQVIYSTCGPSGRGYA